MATAKDDDGSLKRLGGGRWQTRDERFTIEPQSGTWVVVDAEQTDDLGLPLIRGPFGSLGAAKAAIGDARVSGKPVKPLPTPTRAAARTKAPTTAPRSGPGHASKAAPAAEPAAEREHPKPSKPAEPSTRSEPTEPRWLTDLAPAERRRARDAIKRLADAGAPDPEGMTRRDVAGDVPAIAAYAVRRRIDGLGPDAPPAAIVEALADGRDDDLGVRWRIVDGDGRPILIPRGASSSKRR